VKIGGIRKPDLYIFARDLNEDRFVIRLRGIPPYFYAPWKEVPEDVRGDPVLDFRGRAVVRKETDFPGQVKWQRRNYTYTDEADIEYEKRVLTDKGIYCGFRIVNAVIENGMIIGGVLEPTPSHNILPHVLIGDIEVLSPPTIMPVPERPNYPVVVITFMDVTTLKKTLFILANKNKVYYPATEFEEVVYCRTERELFFFVFKYLDEHKFDLWTGWWWKNFDVPYLVRRAQHIVVDSRRFSVIREVRLKQNPKKPRIWWVKIGGMETTDLLEQYRVLTKPEGQKLTWDMKFIVHRETKGKTVPSFVCVGCENDKCVLAGKKSDRPRMLVHCKGFTYTDYGDSILELHRGVVGEPADHMKLIKYCFNDVIAAYLIDRARNLTHHYDMARRLRGCFTSDAHSAYRVHKSFLLRLSNKPLPTNFFGFKDRQRRVTGAFVMKPIWGLHEYVGTVDITSIYPMLFENLNASPESLSKEGSLVAANGTRFRKSPLALFPRAIRTLRKEREQFRQAKDALKVGTPEWDIQWTEEQATKFDVRSFYGATRNVNPAVTQAITATGQFILKVKTIPFIKSLGYEPVYGDTDSVHVKFKSDNWREGLLLAEAINKYYVTLSKEMGFTEPLRIKFEEFFRRIFYKTKKRWAGFCTIRDGKPYNKLIIMGLEAKRSDSAIVTVKAMKDYMLAINMEGDTEKALSQLRVVYEGYRDLPQTEIGIPKGLSKELKYYDHYLHAEAVKWSTKHLRIKFRQDKKPRLLYGYVQGHPLPKLGKKKTRAFAIQDADVDGAVINYEKMIDVTLIRKFHPLLQAVGLDWTSVHTSHRPSQLVRWMPK